MDSKQGKRETNRRGEIMLKAVFSRFGEEIELTDELWQYDFGQKIQVTGIELPDVCEVHFQYDNLTETKTVTGYKQEDALIIDIPNEALTSRGIIKLYIYLVSSEEGRTVNVAIMHVNRRMKPEGFEVPEDIDLFHHTLLAADEYMHQAKNAKENAEKAADRAESARDLAEGSARTAQGSAEAAEQAKNEAVEAAESIKNAKVPTKTSELENDSGFLAADTEISWGRKDGTFAGMQSVALGLDVEAFGDNSFAEGNNTVAYGDNSHAEGYQSQATGQNAHSEGENNIASGQGAHAEGGAGTTASDKYAHAEGYGTTASAQAAHSEGYNTYATGKYSHVEGYNSKATADMAHAENYGTEASGKNSHAEGLISIAKGNGSHAEGFGTVASGKYQHVQGKYNVEDTEGRYAHIVGSGSDAERRNIHTLDWEGNAEYAGDVTATVNGKKVHMSTIAGVLLQPGAAAHNAIYREKYLGDTVTAEQAAAIADGSFEDLFIGDYWTMGGVNYRIADFDYWYRTGFPEASRVEKHHAVIVPDTSIATGQMNGSNTTSGGYRNSLMKSKMNDTISALPPEIRSRLLVHNALLDGAWTEISVDPMNEIMVYGCYILADNSNKQTSENRQLSLFRMSPQARYAGGNYWIRNYANATEFTLVSYYGDASKDAATSTYGIRPVFAITGENR